MSIELSTKSMAKKAYIIEKSINVFRRKGFVNVTMQDIVDECQISRGGLYKYFATPAEVFEEILKHSQEDAEVIERQMSENKSFMEIMNDFFCHQTYELLNINNSLRIATYEYFINQKNDKTEEMIKKSLNENVLLMENLIKYGIGKKEISKAANASALAFQIVAWLEGLNLISIVSGVDEDLLKNQFSNFLSSL